MNESGEPMDVTVDRPGPCRVTERSVADGSARATSEEAGHLTVKAPREPAGVEEARETVFDVRDLSVYYGELPRRARREPADPQQRDHGPDRLLGMRQDHGAAVPQPDERPDRRRARRGGGPLPRRGSLRRRRRPGGGPPADRHGLPEAEPVPEVDLRQRRVRAQDRRLQGEHGRARGGGPAERGALGRGQGQAEGIGHGAVRRAAAAAVHRPGDRHQARRDPDGRAVLRAGPHRHRPDRGPDAGAGRATTRS